MSDHLEPQVAPQAPTAKNGRRRFLGAGAAVPPVIMTLASAPALGTECFTPSRSLSRNTSHSQAHKRLTCSPTNSVTQLRTKANFAPLTITGSTTSLAHAKFHDIFAVAGPFNYGTKSLLTVLTENSSPTVATTNPVATVIAALVNIRKNPGGMPAISEVVLKDMWRLGATGNYYPYAGVAWDLAKVQAYLLNNFIVRAG